MLPNYSRIMDIGRISWSKFLRMFVRFKTLWWIEITRNQRELDPDPLLTRFQKRKIPVFGQILRDQRYFTKMAIAPIRE